MSYWDTSALVKLYVPEPDSSIFDRHAQNSTDPAVTARIASWEARATFRRKEMEGVLQPGGTQMLHAELLADITANQWQVIEPSAGVEAEFARVLDTCARQNPPVLIRTLDAIHLASARIAGETEVVATDKRLREAASVLGFSLFPK